LALSISEKFIFLLTLIGNVAGKTRKKAGKTRKPAKIIKSIEQPKIEEKVLDEISEIKQEDIQKQPIKKTKRILFSVLLIIAIIFGIIIAVPLINYIISATAERTITETVPREKTITNNITIQKNISFQQYIDDPYQMESQNIKLKGYLERYVRWDHNAGVYVEALADDYGNKLDFIELQSQQKALFPKSDRSSEIYEIEAVFIRKYTTLYLKPSTIIISDKGTETIEQTETISTNETIARKETSPKFPNARKFLLGIFGK